MNMQSLINKGKKMQNDMLKIKEEINKKTYEGSSSIVTVKMKGTKELTEVKINASELEKDDIEMLEDMIIIAVNESIQKIETETEKKLGSISNMFPGMF